MPNGKSIAVKAIEELLSGRSGGPAPGSQRESLGSGRSQSIRSDPRSKAMYTFSTSSSQSAQNTYTVSLGETKGDTSGWPEPVMKNMTLETLPQSQSNVLKQMRREKKIRVMTLTWNLHGKKWPEDLGKDLIPPNMYHIYAIGTQECERSILASALNTSKKKWEEALGSTLGANYVMIRSHTLQAIHLAVFVHRALVPLVFGVRSMCVARGLKMLPLKRMGNKGAVGIHLQVGSSKIVFISCHLAAHQGHVDQRNADFRKINQHMAAILKSSGASKSRSGLKRRARVHPAGAAQSQTLASVNNDAKCLTDTKEAEYIFWVGDFNYRIDHTSQSAVIGMIDAGSRDELLKLDQMRRQRSKDPSTFGGLVEGPLLFRPTYKFKPKTDTYAQKKQRIPSWTDRVLFRDSNALELLSYRSLDHIRTSDHRPVEATFEIGYSPHVHFLSEEMKEQRGVPPGRSSIRQVFSGLS